MGLIGIRPAFRIEADGDDVTASIRDRLVSLELSDKAGLSSDEITITLADDLDRPVLLPPSGSVVAVFLGYDDEIEPAGEFTIDGGRMTGPRRPGVVLTGRAKPVVQSRIGALALQSQRSGSWDGVSMGDVLRAIAGRNGLVASVAADFDDVALPFTAQVDESDASIMARLARHYDATIKILANRVVAVPAAGFTSASGRDLPVVELGRGDVERYDATFDGSYPAGTVVATWYDADSGTTREESAGAGEPVRRLRHGFPDAAAASAAAAAELGRSGRNGATLRVDMPWRSGLSVESRLRLDGFRPGVDGFWRIDEARTRLTPGKLTCAVKCNAFEPVAGERASSTRRAAEPDYSAARDAVLRSFPWLPV